MSGSFSTTGASHMILRVAELGLLDAVSSEQALREAERNLAAKLPVGLPAFRTLTKASVRWVADPSDEELRPFREQADAKDVPILTAAVRSGCSSLVTFNVGDYRGASIRVETPGDFLRRLRSVLEGLLE